MKETRRSFAFARRLNKTFMPVFGPAQLGPYGEPDRLPVEQRDCPMCGAIMAEHIIEHRTGRPTKVHCPLDAA